MASNPPKNKIFIRHSADSRSTQPQWESPEEIQVLHLYRAVNMINLIYIDLKPCQGYTGKHNFD